MEKRAIIIIGSGPAGISTALSLKQIAPELAPELLVLERDQHPRPKLCGGGVTSYAEEILRSLDISFKIASFPIHKVRFHFGSRSVHFRRKDLMRIVRRDEFDAALVRQARSRGIEVLENQKVSAVRRTNGALEVRTRNNVYTAKVVVGADGVNSLVRKKMISGIPLQISFLIETLVRADPEQTQEFMENMAVFEFRASADSFRGYLWDFPSLVDGQPYLNVGLFDSGIHGSNPANLKAILVDKLRRRNIDADHVEVKGHPERWFSPEETYGCPNVLLVGDAAGIEPWLGEGISMALAYGPVAAGAIRSAFEKNDFSFAGYTELIKGDKLGRLLQRNRRIARYFYTAPSQALLSKFAKLWEAYFQFTSGDPLPPATHQFTGSSATRIRSLSHSD